MVYKYLDNSNTKKYLGIVIERKHMKGNTKYDFVYKGVFTYLSFYFTDFTHFNNSMIDNMIHYIKSFIDNTHPVLSGKKLHIIVVPTNIEKEFPKDKYLTSEHANNGFTTTFLADGSKEIFIYRYEDMYKVLLHEMIHYFDMDLKGKFKIRNDENTFLLDCFIDSTNYIDLNEAYTETLAVYLYIVFTYRDINQQKREIEKHRIRFIRIMNALSSHAKEHGGQIIQQSHVYSYYVCRAVLFDHLDAFLKIVKIKNATENTKLVLCMMMDILSKEDLNNKYSGYTTLKSMRSINISEKLSF